MYKERDFIEWLGTQRSRIQARWLSWSVECPGIPKKQAVMQWRIGIAGRGGLAGSEQNLFPSLFLIQAFSSPQVRGGVSHLKWSGWKVSLPISKTKIRSGSSDFRLSKSPQGCALHFCILVNPSRSQVDDQSKNQHRAPPFMIQVRLLLPIDLVCSINSRDCYFFYWLLIAHLPTRS